VGWIAGRSAALQDGRSSGIKRDAWLIAAGARIHYGAANAWSQPFFFSFQPAYHVGDTESLSSSYEFVSTLGWQGKRFSIQIRHISNGGLHEPNRGETMALVGVGFDL
jgi:hypothetical protein